MFGTDFLMMPLGMVIAQALKSSSSPPTVVEIKQSESKDTKEVKEVIKKMVMAKKEDRMKTQEAHTAFKNIFGRCIIGEVCPRVILF